MKKILFILLLLPVVSVFAQNKVEKWRIFELTLKGPSQGNPFTEIQLSAVFTNGNQSKTINGFYDGNGTYKIRFMPQETGTWNYVTSSNSKPLNNKKGSFVCVAPSGDNHGPVVVSDTFC